MSHRRPPSSEGALVVAVGVAIELVHFKSSTMAIYESSLTYSSPLLRGFVPRFERPCSSAAAASWTLLLSLLIYSATQLNASQSSSSSNQRSMAPTTSIVELWRALDMKRFARFWRAFYRDRASGSTTKRSSSILCFLWQFLRPWWNASPRSRSRNEEDIDDEDDATTNASSITSITSSRALEPMMRPDPTRLGPYFGMPDDSIIQHSDDDDEHEDEATDSHYDGDENRDPRSPVFTTQTMEQTVYKLRKVISLSSSSASSTKIHHQM